jgi:hypothetical protein
MFLLRILRVMSKAINRLVFCCKQVREENSVRKIEDIVKIEINFRIVLFSLHRDISYYNTAIHPVLHVSQLKQHLGRGQTTSPQLPITTPDGQLKIYPHSILERRAIKRANVAVPQILVRWTNLPLKMPLGRFTITM